MISADVRPRERREPGDLPEPAHPHLDDAELRVGLEPAQRQRHAELVVVVALRGDRPQVRRAERGEDVLRRRLARRAGDRRRLGPPTGRAPRRAIAASAPCSSSGTSAAAAPRASACATKSAPAAHRDEEVALLDPARVDLHAGDLVGPRPRDEPAERLDERRARAGSPARRHPAEHLARDLPVVERHLPGRELLLRLGAPAGDHDDVAGTRRRRAPSSIAARRSSSISSRRARPTATSAAIAAGSSERGLSEVRIARSASSADDPPHQRPLAAVAVAAGAEDDREPAVAEPAGGADHVLERVGSVGIVDDHREGLACVDRLEAAGHARRPTRSRAGSRRGRRRARAAASAAPIAFCAVEARRAAAARSRRGRPSPASNVIASGSSAASRRPHSSPTFTTARSACVEERALSPRSTPPSCRGS